MRATLIFIALLAAQAHAQDLDRTLKTLDFEERRLGNPEELPMHWTKVEGPGMPHYVNGRFSTERARSGKYSFLYELNGGSITYRYDPRQVPVKGGAHFRVPHGRSLAARLRRRRNRGDVSADPFGDRRGRPHHQARDFGTRSVVQPEVVQRARLRSDEQRHVDTQTMGSSSGYDRSLDGELWRWPALLSRERDHDRKRSAETGGKGAGSPTTFSDHVFHESAFGARSTNFCSAIETSVKANARPTRDPIRYNPPRELRSYKKHLNVVTVISASAAIRPV